MKICNKLVGQTSSIVIMYGSQEHFIFHLRWLFWPTDSRMRTITMSTAHSTYHNNKKRKLDVCLLTSVWAMKENSRISPTVKWRMIIIIMNRIYCNERQLFDKCMKTELKPIFFLFIKSENWRRQKQHFHFLFRFLDLVLFYLFFLYAVCSLYVHSIFITVSYYHIHVHNHFLRFCFIGHFAS